MRYGQVHLRYVVSLFSLQTAFTHIIYIILLVFFPFTLFFSVDYCDIPLTREKTSVRKAHNAGYKHKLAVRNYYANFLPENTYIDEIPMPPSEDGRLSSRARRGRGGFRGAGGDRPPFGDRPPYSGGSASGAQSYRPLQFAPPIFPPAGLPGAPPAGAVPPPFHIPAGFPFPPPGMPPFPPGGFPGFPPMGVMPGMQPPPQQQPGQPPSQPAPPRQ